MCDYRVWKCHLAPGRLWRHWVALIGRPRNGHQRSCPSAFKPTKPEINSEKFYWMSDIFMNASWFSIHVEVDSTHIANEFTGQLGEWKICCMSITVWYVSNNNVLCSTRLPELSFQCFVYFCSQFCRIKVEYIYLNGIVSRRRTLIVAASVATLPAPLRYADVKNTWIWLHAVIL